jgi:UDP-N-acetylmuramoyl-tripeptide--D-alanyl-D-alanine ligase
MRELGEAGPGLHEGLAEAVASNKVDLLFAAGSLMGSLVGVLPGGMIAQHAERSADLVENVCAAIRPGDAVMVKGSLSMQMALVVKALKERYGARDTARTLKG